jgi:hypothetical protein
VTFKVPRLGTYQAVVRKDAGHEDVHAAQLTHRAVIGISMGGGGTSMVGMRHHDRFDVVAPLGGPSTGRGCSTTSRTTTSAASPIPKGTTLADIQLTRSDCADSSTASRRDVHGRERGQGQMRVAADADGPLRAPVRRSTLVVRVPEGTGNGGSFSRRDYTQIFRDLALMFGNPNGENLDARRREPPGGRAPRRSERWWAITQRRACAVWVDPLDGPDHDKQQMLDQQCPAERCAHTLTMTNYFDDEYNPDGIFPVITVCDGNQQQKDLTPWANTWHADGNDYPLELGLAVDYNANGVRDEMEPILRAGHENWSDVGADGKAEQGRAGLPGGRQRGPRGRRLQRAVQPSGTENDHRFTEGEPFEDFGLDGVRARRSSPQAVGSRRVTATTSARATGSSPSRAASRRSGSATRTRSSASGRRTSPAARSATTPLKRVDLFTDGGTRDLFNFAVDAQHLAGTFKARGRNVQYLTEFTAAPGLDPSKPGEVVPPRIVYEDMPGIVFQRYGHTEPTKSDFDLGSGQHVGTVGEITARLQTALYFIGSRWPEPELRQFVEDSNVDPDPDAPECQVTGNCTIEFTSSFGRTAPVGITFPPGYAHAKQQGPQVPGHLHAARLRAGPGGSGGGDHLPPQLDEQPDRRRREPPPQGDPRLRRRPLPRDKRQGGVHPRQLLHRQRARERRAGREVVDRADGPRRQELQDDGLGAKAARAAKRRSTPGTPESTW